MKKYDQISRVVRGPERFPKIGYFLKKNFNTQDLLKIVDIGGVIHYYDLLNFLFPKSNIILLNINKQDLKGCKNGILADGTSLPFKPETFDIVLCLDLIEHLIDPDSLLIEVYKILKKEGVFLITSPNLADFYSRLVFLFGYTPYAYNPSIRYKVASPFTKFRTIAGEMYIPDHKSVFTYKGLKEILRLRGFKVIYEDGFTYAVDCFVYGVGKPKIRKIIDRILPKGLKEGILMGCKKV